MKDSTGNGRTTEVPKELINIPARMRVIKAKAYGRKLFYKLFDMKSVTKIVNQYRAFEKRIYKLYQFIDKADSYISDQIERNNIYLSIRAVEKDCFEQYSIACEYGVPVDADVYSRIDNSIEYLRERILGVCVNNEDIDYYFSNEGSYYELRSHIEYSDDFTNGSFGISGSDTSNLKIKLPYAKNIETVKYDVKTIRNAIDIYEDNENKLTLEDLDEIGDFEVYMFLKEQEENILQINSTQRRLSFLK